MGVGVQDRAFFASLSGYLFTWNTSSEWSISACLLMASHTWRAWFHMHHITPVRTLGWWWELYGMYQSVWVGLWRVGVHLMSPVHLGRVTCLCSLSSR